MKNIMYLLRKQFHSSSEPCSVYSFVSDYITAFGIEEAKG